MQKTELQENRINIIKQFVVNEAKAWSRAEVVFFLATTTIVLICSYFTEDSKIAVVSAVCGIIYTILAGKGKVYSYIFGIIGTLSCAYLSYKIALYGNFGLHFFYYFPMEVIGIINWQKHLNKSTNEIIKTKLQKKEFLITTFLISLISIITYCLFVYINDKCPIIDSLITVLSIAGMILTVKRCIEQWIVWTIVNFLSVLMWFSVFSQGEHIFSIFIVRIIYFILGIYFFFKWKRENCN